MRLAAASEDLPRNEAARRTAEAPQHRSAGAAPKERDRRRRRAALTMAHARRRLQGGPVSETCVRDAAEDLNQYGEKVGVNQLLGEYAIRILRDKPPDPVSYLIEEISKRC